MISDRLTRSRRRKETGALNGEQHETKISHSRVKREERIGGTGCALRVLCLCAWGR